MFVKTVNDLQPFTVFTKSSILDIGQGSQYAPGFIAHFEQHLLNVLDLFEVKMCKLCLNIGCHCFLLSYNGRGGIGFCIAAE